MARRIGEAVAVRLSEQAAATDAPVSFIWRDRVYVVREVLGYWRERRAWWNTAAARAVQGDVPEVQPDVVDHGVGGVSGGLHVAIDHEREVWRVEARGPRTVGTGVYDISREASQVSGESNPAWRLLAVAD